MLNDLLTASRTNFKEHTELRAQVNSSQQVTMLAGNLVSNTQSTAGGVSARVYKGGVFGLASAAEYTPESVADVLRAAGDNAIFMDSRVKKGKPPLPNIANPKDAALNTQVLAQSPQESIIAFTKELDDLIVKKYPNLSSRTIAANSLYMEKRLVVTDGAGFHFFQPRSMVYVFLTANTSDGAPVELMKSFEFYGRFDAHFNEPQMCIPELDKMYEQLMHKRDGIFPDPGIKTCIISPELAGMLAHEAVGHTVEADGVLAGSVAAYNLNKQVASELVSMTDFAHTYNGNPAPLPVYVDDEGTPAIDAPLIAQGILVGYMHNRESAAHFNVTPHGNARAFAFSDEPLIRMRNTAILPGTSKLDDMIASVDDGYYLLKTGNGQADATGEFMFSVDMGYEIKGGKLGRAIRETTISGVAFEMLKTVDMVSDDMHWQMAGFCGKKQMMTCSDGGPALKCKLNIGGR